MLLVQNFLQNKSFKELQDEHGVYASISKSNHKFSLNYDQFESKENDLLAQECRGLILSTGSVLMGPIGQNGNLIIDYLIPGLTSIVAYPMNRFFNYGQGAAANINWSDPNLSVLEKLDGSLCIVYFDMYLETWCVATRSVPEADLFLDNGLYTFRTLFEKALKATNQMEFDEFCSWLDPYNTYCFELTTPLNRIVVKYEEYKVTLLSIRDNLSCKEKLLTQNTLHGVPVVQSYGLNDINKIIDLVSSLNPLEHEGVVVVDSNFNRIKIKNASYVAFNKARDILGNSERNCLELILAEKDDDVIAALPQEIVNNLLKIKEKVVEFFKIYDFKYIDILQEAEAILPGDKKTFALTLQKYEDLWQAPFFNIYAGKSKNMKEFVALSKKEGTWSNSFLDKVLDICKKI